MEVVSRYFINNFSEGMVTILEILLGFFVISLNNPNEPISSTFVIITGLATSISMLISGASGSYLSERAKQKKEEKTLERAMDIIEEDEISLEEEVSKEEIQKAMLIPVNTSDYGVKRKFFFKSCDL